MGNWVTCGALTLQKEANYILSQWCVGAASHTCVKNESIAHVSS